MHEMTTNAFSPVRAADALLGLVQPGPVSTYPAIRPSPCPAVLPTPERRSASSSWPGILPKGLLCRAGSEYQEATDWHRQHPPV
jgi:hypothetical protein